MDKKSLQPSEKLRALAYRFYHDNIWDPQAGDYYTSSRDDLELYQIVKIEDGTVYTRYCHQKTPYSTWPEEDFTNKGFGLRRVHVPHWCFE